MLLHPGAVIADRYEIVRPLSHGGCAQISLARDLHSGQHVALKVLEPDHTRDPSVVSRFQHEAHLAAAVDHPRIVRVYDTGRDGPHYYLVMEWVDGQDLRQMLHRQAPLPVNRAVAILLDVLDGLGAIHQAGIVHGDIKPENVLIDQPDRAKLIDFGIARAVIDTEAIHLTQTADTAGTAAYMSPEQVRGERIGVASDLYAIGVLLFELVTGQLPFTDPDPLRVLDHQIHTPPPRPRDFNRQIPASLDTIILRLLAKPPAERFADVASLRTALLSSNQQPTIKHAYRPDHGPQVPRSATTWRSWATIMVCCLMLIAGITSVRRGDDSRVILPDSEGRIGESLSMSSMIGGVCEGIGAGYLAHVEHVSAMPGSFIHLQFHRQRGERTTVLPAGDYTVPAGVAGRYWILGPKCSYAEVLQRHVDPSLAPSQARHLLDPYYVDWTWVVEHGFITVTRPPGRVAVLISPGIAMTTTDNAQR